MTSTSQTCPERSHWFTHGTALYVIAFDSSRPNLKVGDVVFVDNDMNADADDEISIGDAYSPYVGRTYVSLDPPVLDTPPSLDPKEIARWLDQ